MKKIISVVLAAIMLCSLFAACAKKDDAKIVKVKVTVEADGQKIIENVEVEVEGVDGAEPVAIDAIIQALTEYEISYDIVEMYGHDEFNTIDVYGLENNKYFWELYMNGDDDPVDSRIDACVVADGNELLLVRSSDADETDVTDEAPVSEK